MGGPHHTYFRYDRACQRLKPFISLFVLRMIMASAVLGTFSVVLRAFGRSLGLLFVLLGAFLPPLEAPEVLWGPLGSSSAAPECDFYLLT